MDRILILKADRLCAEALRHIVADTFPAAEIIDVRLIAEARLWLSSAKIDLLIAGATLLDGEVCDFLAMRGDAPRPPHRTLIVTGSRQPHLLARLQALAIAGIFDSSREMASALPFALRQIAEGRRYWSPSVLECAHSPVTPAHRRCAALTATEQLVFAIIGDGADDLTAAERLGLTRSSVQSVRRSLHRKLHVQHKGDLVRLAVQYGFVRFTEDGVVRPGFELLLAAWQTRRRKPGGAAGK